MLYQVQTHALLPYFLFALVYLGILFLARARRDALGFVLVVIFCITLGLRNVENMFIGSDPVLYATILSYPADIKELMGGADYAIFSILHPITGAIFGLRTCFLLLHLLYIPVLFLLFKCLRKFPGIFFLLVGWMLFVNSGLLLLANFFRQGLSVIVLLSILIGLSISRRNERANRIGALGLPLLHLASVVMIPSLLACRKRSYFLISSAAFVFLCCAVHFLPDRISYQSDYFNHGDAGLQQTQLWIKILSIYVMLLIGYVLSRRIRAQSIEINNIQRAAVGLLIPTAALLLTSNAPDIGLRYLYYSYALAFLYVACAVASRKCESLFKLSAIAICMFGLVTWTYPTVAMLLIW